MDGATLLVGATVAAGLLWKTGLAETATEKISRLVGRTNSWIADEEDAWADLPGRLAYRDFFGDVIETRDGWMWAGLELKPLASEAFDGFDWNAAGNRLNRIFAVLPDQTWVQIIMRQDNSSHEAEQVFGRVASACENTVLRQVIESRARHVRREARAGRLVRRRLFAFIGRQMKPAMQRLPLRAVFTSDPFIDLERADFLKLREEVLRLRNAFTAAYVAAGGSVRPIPARVAFELAYERLNPERAEVHPAPAYLIPPLITEASEAGVLTSGNLEGNPLAAVLRPAILLGQTERSKRQTEQIAYDTRCAELFAENPREVLCFTPLEIRGDYFMLGSRPMMTLSLQKLPVKTFAGLMETLTKQAGISFPYEIVTSFQIGDQVNWDEKLERMQNRIRISLMTTLHPNQVEEIKQGELYDLRQQIRKGEEKMGLIGLSVTFGAPTPDELKRRRDLVLVAMRAMEGLEGVGERHMPLDMYLAGLPCTPHTDFRRKPCMTRDAVGLAPLTGASSGIAEDEAIEVLQRADGGLFFWHPRSRYFNSGMSLYCGTSGSGKSGALNRQRTALLASGWRGVTLDFGGSSYRICRAVGGTYIDITDARRTRGLGLFAIRPQSGEEYAPEELTDEGLPLDRLAEVENMLEVLCLDPTKPYETALPPVLSSFLRKMVRKTYTELVDETPTIDHFIRTLRRALKEDRDKGDELASRLEVFAAQGSLGRFLNDRSQPISVECPYTVFDFRAAANDPRLMLVASMAVRNFISRLLAASRKAPKFIDIDEFNVISRYPLICLSIDEAMRTARKLNALCSVASQDPSDFDSEATRGIRANCEVKWLFAMPKPQLAGKVFELSQGVVRLIGNLDGQSNPDFRDAVLIYPGGGCAHLRLRNGALDRRLLLGAGREAASVEEALADVDGLVNERLADALRADGLGVETKSGDVIAK
jgi:hypothetical protein